MTICEIEAAIIRAVWIYHTSPDRERVWLAVRSGHPEIVRSEEDIRQAETWQAGESQKTADEHKDDLALEAQRAEWRAAKAREEITQADAVMVGTEDHPHWLSCLSWGHQKVVIAVALSRQGQPRGYSNYGSSLRPQENIDWEAVTLCTNQLGWRLLWSKAHMRDIFRGSLEKVGLVLSRREKIAS